MSNNDIKEGKRCVQLRKVFLKVLQTSQKQLVLDNMIQTFPKDIIEKYGDVIKSYTQQFLDNVWLNIKDEFEVILKEGAVVEYLNTIDQLCSEQPLLDDGTTLPSFPIYSPEEIVRIQSVARKRKEKEELRSAVEKLMTENNELKNSLLTKRQEAAEIVNAAESVSKSYIDAHQILTNQNSS